MPSNTPLHHKRTQSIQSIDDGLLNLPSPYYDEFSLPLIPLSPKKTIASSISNISSYLYFSLQPSSYRSLPTQDDELDNPSPATFPPRKHKQRHDYVHWTDSDSPANRTNWLLLVSLLLLLSMLINSFLLFEGRGRIYATTPHDGYRVSELGRNYTCYRTHETSFQRVDAFESLDGVYHRDWRDMLGGSDGYIRTALEQPDGKARRVRFGMFHQLECLHRIRMAVSRGVVEEKMGKSRGKRKYAVFLDNLDDSTEWGQCFDYLRQSVLCGADDTVETSDGDGSGWGSFGYGSRRQCRDPGWLFHVTKCGEQGCEGGIFSHGARSG